jgi:HEAT repeat protein
MAVGSLAGVQAETVRVGTREVPLEFPSGAPIQEGSPHVEHGGFMYEVVGGKLGRKYVRDGGWGDVRSRWKPVGDGPGVTVVPVLVVLTTRVYILEQDGQGIVRQRRGVLERGEVDTVYSALALFKAAVEASGEGRFRVLVTVVQDDDPAFLPALTPTEKAGLGLEWLARSLAPRINQARFESEDGSYNGPYAGVFAIHAGLTGSVSRSMVGQTPVTAIPYYGFSQQTPEAALAPLLYSEFRNHVASRRSGEVHNSEPAGLEYPQIDGGPTWLRWLASLSPDWEPRPPAVQVGPGIVELEDGRVAVPVEYADLLAETPGLLGTDPTPVAGLPSVVVRPKAPLGSQAWNVVGSPRPKPAEAPSEVGLHALSTLPDGGGFSIQRSGRSARGYVEFPAAGMGRFSVRVRSNSPEPWHVTLVGESGRTRELLLCGSSRVPAESSHRPTPALAPADGQWHEVVLDPKAELDEPLRAVRFGAGRDQWRFERLPQPAAVLEVSALQPSTAEPTQASVVQAPNPRHARLAEIASPADAADVAAIREGLESPDTSDKLNALAAIVRASVPGFVPELTELARGAVTAPSYLAVRALADRKDDESKTILLETIERGPFEHGKRFAIEALSGSFSPQMAAVLSQMGARSWQSRLAGVRALARIGDQNSQILMVSTLVGEPDPAVRLAVSEGALNGIPLVARRVLYAAVNDPSEAVRLASLVRLLDSPLAEIRAEALGGVRDESPWVRLGLLAEIAVRRNDADRPALRLAVTDPLPAVRAAALDALAGQPGPVLPEEVANVARDSHPLVAQAYQRLARAKGIGGSP